MKERKRQKVARMESELDYNGFVENPQETTNETSADETITKLSQLEKVYEEKKKVRIFICFSLIHLLCFSLAAALLNAIELHYVTVL